MNTFLREVFDLEHCAPKEEIINLKNIREHLSQRLQQYEPQSPQELQQSIPEKKTAEKEKKDEEKKDEEKEGEPKKVEDDDDSDLSDMETEETKTSAKVSTPRVKGRLGPNVVKMDYSEHSRCGTIAFLDENKLELESQSNFSSIRANACVFQGRWMYEACLGSAGIQQIGWATIDCEFTHENGVGDSPNSYAYDGKRKKKWSEDEEPYGENWTAGDIIGCCIDLDKGEISFYRNGNSMGVAFKHVSLGEGFAYFPTISMSYGEKVHFNFGSRPFEYPVQEFSPLQAPPSTLSKANYLFDCWRRIFPLCLQSDSQTDMQIESSTSKPQPSQNEVTLANHLLLEELAPLLEEEYIIISLLFPFILDHLDYKAKTIHQPLLSAILSCLEPSELSNIFSSLFSYIGFLVRTSSYQPDFLKGNTSSRNPQTYLALTLALLKSSPISTIFSHHTSFETTMESIMALKQPTNFDLSKLFPDVWWTYCKEEEFDQKKMEKSYQEVLTAVSSHEDLLYQICSLFLSSKTLSKSDGFYLESSTAAVFTLQEKFRKFARALATKNKGMNRSILPPGLSDPSILMNLYFILLRYLNDEFLVSRELSLSKFPKEMFFSNSFYADLPRIGGLFGYLNKHLRNNTTSSDSPSTLRTSAAAPPPPSTPSLSEIIADHLTSLETKSENKPVEVSLETELYDISVLLYHLVVSSRFRQASTKFQSLITGSTLLEEYNNKIKSEKSNLAAYKKTKQKLIEELADTCRLCAWYRISMFSQWKQKALFNKLYFLAELFNSFSSSNPLFSFLPEFYLETLLEIFQALRRIDPPFNFATFDPHVSSGVDKLLNFIVEHLTDNRIINPDTRELLLQTMSSMVQTGEFVRLLEKHDLSKKKLITALISSFDNRFWVQSSGILLRFWKGFGFCQELKKSSEISSETFQKIFQQNYKANPEIFNSFINSIFNNLNWSFTEFTVSMRGFQTSMGRAQSMQQSQQEQRKCNVMFDLSVTLLRLLEVLSMETSAIFLENETNIDRVSELILLVIQRTTVGTEAQLFGKFVDEEPPNILEKVSRGGILGPVVGIILNLDSSYLKNGGSFNIISSLLKNDLLFRMESFDYICKLSWEKEMGKKGKMYHPSELCIDRLPQLYQMISRLKKEHSKIEEIKQTQLQTPKTKEEEEESSDNTCPICYSEPNDTKFNPCGHISCHKCINRHLLNNTRCFFCNAEVASVTSLKN